MNIILGMIKFVWYDGCKYLLLIVWKDGKNVGMVCVGRVLFVGLVLDFYV